MEMSTGVEKFQNVFNNFENGKTPINACFDHVYLIEFI